MKPFEKQMIAVGAAVALVGGYSTGLLALGPVRDGIQPPEAFEAAAVDPSPPPAGPEPAPVSYSQAEPPAPVQRVSDRSTVSKPEKVAFATPDPDNTMPDPPAFEAADSDERSANDRRSADAATSPPADPPSTEQTAPGPD